MGKHISEGMRFGHLLVKEKIESRTKVGLGFWLCLCDCGKEKVVQGVNLVKGKILSCGCRQYTSTKPYATSVSGTKGVDFLRRRGKWRVRIVHNNESHFIGYYDSLHDAIKARHKAEEDIWGIIEGCNPEGEKTK